MKHKGLIALAAIFAARDRTYDLYQPDIGGEGAGWDSYDNE